MRLTSGEFLLFGALVALCWYALPRGRTWVLNAAGLWFFLRTGWESLGCFLAVFGSVWLCGVWMGRAPGNKERNKPALLLCLGLNFSLLLHCKGNLPLPLGISYYLFLGTGYLLEVYRGTDRAEKDPGKLMAFLSFFPQAVQGPISRRRELQPQLTEIRPFDPRDLSEGLRRMVWGSFKKLVAADRAAVMVAALAEAEGGGFLLRITLYAFQIYGDFTGGIDLVLGFARCLGVRLPENFHKPFAAGSVAEYWRRWHITLGTWMRDFVFYPLSVSGPIRYLARRSRSWGHFRRLPVWTATALTWLATGLWHGLSPNFLLWGMLNCGVILVSQQIPKRGGKWFSMIHTFLLMNLIRSCDLYPDVGLWLSRVGSLVTGWGSPLPNLGLDGVDLGIFLLAGAAMVLRDHLSETTAPGGKWAGVLALLTLLLGRYGVGYVPGNFIYNQF